VDNTIIGALDEHGRHGHCSESRPTLVELNLRLLAKTAKGFDGMRLL
jgi:hypothetical protein